MSISFRRYGILIPLRFNDGQPVPEVLIAGTLLALRQRFDAISSETQIIRGQWEAEGQVFRDEHCRVFVDVEDSPASWEFFFQFKQGLKLCFQQIDIWVTSHPVDVL
jgi:hypothetical protein